MMWLDSITDSMDMSLSKLQERVTDRRTWHPAAHGVTKSHIQLSNNSNKMVIVVTESSVFPLSSDTDP